jgi:hypothetical protein
MFSRADRAQRATADCPFPRSWWVHRPVLLAGCYPGSLDPVVARVKLQALLDNGIRTVVSLQPREEIGAGGLPFMPYEPLLTQLAAERSLRLSCLRHPIEDCGVPTPEMMASILDAIDGSIAASHPVYVHCWGGHGRTGTVVGCWLIRHGCSGNEALSEVTALRRHDHYLRENPAPQTDDQRQLVRNWAELDPAINGRSAGA